MSDAYLNRSGISILWDKIKQKSSDLDEYDTSDGWHVRKWANGWVEMFKIISSTATTGSWVSWGNASQMFYSDNLVPSQTLPVKLTRKYFEECSVLAHNGWAIYLSRSGYDYSGISSTTSHIYMGARPTKPSENVNFTFGLLVIGKWK